MSEVREWLGSELITLALALLPNHDRQWASLASAWKSYLESRIEAARRKK